MLSGPAIKIQFPIKNHQHKIKYDQSLEVEFFDNLDQNGIPGILQQCSKYLSKYW